MIHPPQNRHRSSLTLAVTCTAGAFTVALLVLLALNVGNDSTPPPVFVAAITALTLWAWRIHLHRADVEQRADEALIATIRGAVLDDERRREEETFREITRWFNEEGRSRGID